MAARKILKVIKSKPTIEGAGVHLKRVFGFSEAPAMDPFLLLDDFRSDDPARYLAGFPWHPHRGIETITYMLEGTVEHGDSLGNRGVIGPGDVQWMTAGSGIIHQEMPKAGEGGRMGGFQLWANLPASQKMMEPRYREVKALDIPEVRSGKASVRIISGTVEGVRGPVRDVVIDPMVIDVTVPAQEAFSLAVPAGHAVFAYVIEGGASFCGQTDPYAYEAEGSRYFDMKREALLGNGSLAVFGDGTEIRASAAEKPVRFLLIAGRPIGEPVAWYGPIVMNTQEELRTAFEEYRNGTLHISDSKSSAITIIR
jgi:quercetin 2,3-dioxygenase